MYGRIVQTGDAVHANAPLRLHGQERLQRVPVVGQYRKSHLVLMVDAVQHIEGYSEPSEVFFEFVPTGRATAQPVPRGSLEFFLAAPRTNCQ